MKKTSPKKDQVKKEPAPVRRGPTFAREANAYRLERVYGSFTRSFSLPTTVDGSRINAVYKDGVLNVTVPKLEAAKPKKIEIQAA